MWSASDALDISLCQKNVPVELRHIVRSYKHDLTEEETRQKYRDGLYIEDAEWMELVYGYLKLSTPAYYLRFHFEGWERVKWAAYARTCFRRSSCRLDTPFGKFYRIDMDFIQTCYKRALRYMRDAFALNPECNIPVELKTLYYHDPEDLQDRKRPRKN